MSLQYEYSYVLISCGSNRCLDVFTSTAPEYAEDYLPDILLEIPTYDRDYFLKYYIDGNWYEDAEGTIPWTSSLI